jgi:uncharacterized membrane protein
MASSPTGREQLGLTAAANMSTTASQVPPPPKIVKIVTSRCSMCHAAEPVWNGVQIAPKAVLLDTPANIARTADAINLQAVLSHAMPPNNITAMTEDERAAIASWVKTTK